MANTPNLPGKNFDIFDPTFEPISYHAVDDRLLGIELLLARKHAAYLLKIETMNLHMERLESEDSSDESDDDISLVLPSDEILPSDLVSIKHQSTEDLMPYLIKQSDSN